MQSITSRDGRERHRVGGETYETDCQVRYQGQYEDYETGFYYNRNRYYMPEKSMYSQHDPIGIAGGNPSLYGYVWDSTKQVDVFGLDVAQGVGNGKSFTDFMDPEELARYERYWKQEYGDMYKNELNTRQRQYTTPGTRSIKDQKLSGTGDLYVRETIYDDFGRRIGNNDYSSHGRPKDHTNPHYHANPYVNPTQHGRPQSGLHPNTPRR